MKNCLLVLFLFILKTAIAQQFPIDHDEALYWAREKGIRTISLSSNIDYGRVQTDEWEFSRTGKLVVFRTYISETRGEDDPYPELPETVMQSQEDSLRFKDHYGQMQVLPRNYHFRNAFGIWQRSFYLPGQHNNISHNEMQYAFDADSNLIYYRSQMDYARPLSYRYLSLMERYDSLGNVTERTEYDMMICEPCPNWYPQFEMFSHEETRFDYKHGTAQTTKTECVEHLWHFDENIANKYFFSPCPDCVENESRRRERTTERIFAIENRHLSSGRERRKIEKAYAANPTFFFNGDSMKVTEDTEHSFYVEYW